MKEEMPKGGVNELLKSPSGRAYLDKLQKKYWKETLQPNNPLFQKVWGKDIMEREKRLEETKRRGQEEYQEQLDKKKWEKKNQWRTR